MGYKVSMVSLGCPKNQVDAEQMLYTLKEAGFELGVPEAEADAIIINTCGFIEDAKSEAIENIIEAAQYKNEKGLPKIIVTGCLAERYRDDVTAEIPEADVCVGIGANGDIAKIVRRAIEGKCENCYGEKDDLDLNSPRILGGYPFTAYIKVADGCDNRCTYCAIPEIRGRLRSRKIEDIVAEAKALANKGVRELIVVAQDTTAYGTDIYGEPRLAQLLRELCKIEKLHWIRTLYTYPDKITDELIDTIKSENKLVKYLDIPLQHINNDILRKMNRKGRREDIEALIRRLRAEIPEIALRTTFITGFPFETDKEFTELHEFIKETRFDRLGCFAYSEEENTPAAEFDCQVEKQVRLDRADAIMSDQMTIAAEKNNDKIGKTLEVLIEGWDDYIKCYFGRTQFDAPEIDGKIFFSSEKPLVLGGFVSVEVTDSIEYDLLGEAIL